LSSTRRGNGAPSFAFDARNKKKNRGYALMT
jgi:hypothetical protein